MADSFAKRLRAARIAKNFRTMRDFARSLDINENTYARYERGQSHPSPATLDRICRDLGISADELDPDVLEFSRVPEAAPGFADNPTDSLGRSGADGTAADAPSTARDVLSSKVWALAAVLARAQGLRPTDVKAIARNFRNLREDPVAKAATMLSSIGDAGWTPEIEAELGAAITAVVQHFDAEAGRLRD